jgi:hypothetical protein
MLSKSTKIHPSKKVADQDVDVWTITYFRFPPCPGFVDRKEYRRNRDKSAANSPGTRVYEVSRLRRVADCSFKPPEFLVQAAKDALDDVAANQYSHTRGRPRLRQALANAYSPFFGRKLDLETVIGMRNLELRTRKL